MLFMQACFLWGSITFILTFLICKLFKINLD